MHKYKRRMGFKADLIQTKSDTYNKNNSARTTNTNLNKE